MEGKDPLDQFLAAAERGELELLERLGADSSRGPEWLSRAVRHVDGDGYTALHRAAYNGRVKTMIKLLDWGSEVGAKTDDGWQPLHCAARWGKAGAVWLLLDRGADVNSRTVGGQTPAHLAATLPGGGPGGATGELPGGGTDAARARKRADTDGRRVLKILLCTPGYDAAAVNEQNEPAIEVAARRSGNDDLFRLGDACLVP